MTGRRSVERVVEVGDVVTLDFPGSYRVEPYEYPVAEPRGNALCWSALLLGKKAGSVVVLPEKEGNEARGLITSISRPRRRRGP